MKLKLLDPLPATGAALGVLIVGLAAYSPSRAGILDFLERKDQATVQAAATTPVEPMNPAPVLAPAQAPNYRAIVHQWGPAVVGVTVDDVALHTKDQIVATGHASHARLGVMVQDLNQALAESFGLSRPDGALISSVDPDSPAAAAGLKPGDVITQVDGAPIERADDLSNRIGMDAPGNRVSLQVWRDRSIHETPVKLAKAGPESLQQAASDSGEHGQLGLALRPLTREERSAAGLDHGLAVEDVGGAAARAGIQPGDVLLGIDGQPANSVDQVHSVMRGHPKTVALLIERDGQNIFVPVRLG